MSIADKQEQPHLRFHLGDKVFLKSDEKKRTPMTIIGYSLLFDDEDCSDYRCSWLNSQKKLESELFPDAALTL
jgi:hypothetical protein